MADSLRLAARAQSGETARDAAAGQPGARRQPGARLGWAGRLWPARRLFGDGAAAADAAGAAAAAAAHAGARAAAARGAAALGVRVGQLAQLVQCARWQRAPCSRLHSAAARRGRVPAELPSDRPDLVAFAVAAAANERCRRVRGIWYWLRPAVPPAWTAAARTAQIRACCDRAELGSAVAVLVLLHLPLSKTFVHSWHDCMADCIAVAVAFFRNLRLRLGYPYT
mmetsp:Transcript_4501/g.11362  ORF Transcript_4501/g.11362 Transcript_4501/m.11362 type:complete len:225 (-) Transcript_4501:33-707(-)